MKESIMNILVTSLNLYRVEDDFLYYRVGNNKDLSLVVPTDLSQVVIWRCYEHIWYQNEVITDADELLKFIDDLKYEESQK